MSNPIEAFFRRGGAGRSPGTTLIVALVAAGFLMSFLTSGRLAEPLVFEPAGALARPWTFVSYVLAYSPFGFLAAFFIGLWLWGLGQVVESDLGTPRFLGFFFGITALGAIAFFLGSVATGLTATLSGAWIPTAAVTVAWGTRYPNLPVRFMFVLPLTGRWLAWIAAALVFFGTGNPLLALFSAIPLVLAWAFAADKLPFLPYSARFGRSGRSRRERQREQLEHERYLENVRKREQERREKERLRKLLESSIDDSDGPDAGSSSRR